MVTGGFVYNMLQIESDGAADNDDDDYNYNDNVVVMMEMFVQKLCASVLALAASVLVDRNR